MLSGDIDFWTLFYWLYSGCFLLTVFRVSGGGAVLVLVVCVILVCSLGNFSCCYIVIVSMYGCCVKGWWVGGCVCERLCVFSPYTYSIYTYACWLQDTFLTSVLLHVTLYSYLPSMCLFICHLQVWMFPMLISYCTYFNFTDFPALT